MIDPVFDGYITAIEEAKRESFLHQDQFIYVIKIGKLYQLSTVGIIQEGKIIATFHRGEKVL